jgi:hypothetical protein
MAGRRSPETEIREIHDGCNWASTLAASPATSGSAGTPWPTTGGGPPSTAWVAGRRTVVRRARGATRLLFSAGRGVGVILGRVRLLPEL